MIGGVEYTSKVPTPISFLAEVTVTARSECSHSISTADYSHQCGLRRNLSLGRVLPVIVDLHVPPLLLISRVLSVVVEIPILLSLGGVLRRLLVYPLCSR